MCILGTCTIVSGTDKMPIMYHFDLDPFQYDNKS